MCQYQGPRAKCGPQVIPVWSDNFYFLFFYLVWKLLLLSMVNFKFIIKHKKINKF